MNAISMSLYGDKPKYCVGAVRNAELVPLVYPGWRLVVYANDDVPGECLSALKSRCAEVRPFQVAGGMFNRFLICDDPAFDYWIVRDADSRLNGRERKAVTEWLASGKSFHVIRDHPYHKKNIMGGLFGGKHGIVQMKALMSVFPDVKEDYGPDGEGLDETFLEDNVWPRVIHDCLEHDLCAGTFPATIENHRFCGEIFEISEVNEDLEFPKPGQWEMRIPFMTDRQPAPVGIMG